ncbi:MAG: hypothetical protein PHU85_20135, partial [Phycisphaerae bacterium]|nr:hypothetical protein [Phycisphaerae bacterium]
DNVKAAVLVIELATGGAAIHRLHPTRQDDCAIRLDGDSRRQAEQDALNLAVQDGNYARLWRRYVRWRMVRRVWHYANPLHWRRLKRESLIGAWLLLRGSFSSAGRPNGH